MSAERAGSWQPACQPRKPRPTPRPCCHSAGHKEHVFSLGLKFQRLHRAMSLREWWNTPWELSVLETRAYLIQRALFPYPGAGRSHSCLLGGPCRTPSQRVCQDPGLPAGCTTEGRQMSLTLQNSLGVPPGPRKYNGHSDTMCEASILRSSLTQERPSGWGMRGRGLHPAPDSRAEREERSRARAQEK